jgi:hypothetical protein
MSKFGGLDYMVLVQERGTGAHDKNIISRSALQYAMWKGIPLARRFSSRRRETSSRSRFDIRPFAHKGEFSPLTGTSLNQLTYKDKLFLFAHANAAEVGPASANVLAGMLQLAGLRAVGLITFKACDVGVGSFLEEFVASLARRGVVVGWAKGYKGAAATDTTSAGGNITHVQERIYHDDRNEINGDARVKIVTSPNNPFVDSIGRFKVAQDTADWLSMVQID